MATRGLTHERAAPILQRLPRERPTMVEVGVGDGELGEHLLRARSDLRWIGVDNWLPAEEQPEAYKATGDRFAMHSRREADALARSVFERLAQFGERATILRRDSSLPATELRGVDLVYIDGRHDYDGAMADITAWWPVAVIWLGGHDYLSRNKPSRIAVNDAVDDWARRIGASVELDVATTWWIRKP